MADNKQQEEWIDNVLNSTNGMQRASPGPFLYENIINKLNTTPPFKTFSFPVMKLAAAVILLLALNAGSVVYYNSRSRKTVVNEQIIEIPSVTTYNY